jgi:hypothetical protein
MGDVCSDVSEERTAFLFTVTDLVQWKMEALRSSETSKHTSTTRGIHRKEDQVIINAVLKRLSLVFNRQFMIVCLGRVYKQCFYWATQGRVRISVGKRVS